MKARQASGSFLKKTTKKLLLLWAVGWQNAMPMLVGRASPAI
jgi:hypothetical protein